jgi:zinc finger protein
MATARFRWFPHGGRRHAVPNALVPNTAGETLCGLEVLAPVVPPPPFPDWCWPECARCDTAWRSAEGTPPRPQFPCPRPNERPRTTAKTGDTP